MPDGRDAMRLQVYRASRRGGVAVVAVVLLAGCAAVQTPDRGKVSGFPLTITNCGQTLTFDRPPERVVAIGDNAIPLLAAVDALDTVVGLVGEPPLQVYDAATRRAVKQMPRIGSGESAGGSVQISLEVVINKHPDLVVGATPTASSSLTQDSLARVGIPFLVLPSWCAEDPIRDPTFADVYSQVKLYGRVFGAEQQAAAAVADLRDRVAAVRESAAGSPARSAAVLFQNPTYGPGAYGDNSMSDAQLEVLGITNVFGDVSKRYFEPSIEEIIARNPDWLILLHTEGQPQQVKQAFLATPGVQSMTAVRNDNIVVLNFSLTDPPSPLSVEGLERLADAID